jgi:Holliday junction DNA helicase RuvB
MYRTFTFLVVVLFAGVVAPAQDFWAHWGDGKAELGGYSLKQPRYGTLRSGTAVLVFVTEDFLETLRVKVEPAAAGEIARRSRGTPRIANRLLRRVRDFAQVQGDGVITRPIVAGAMDRLAVDEKGFDEMDRRLLLSIIEKFEGGPVGLDTLAAALNEEKDTLEEVYEPYLIQEGFLDRTPRGRQATKLAYEYFGRKKPASSQERLL